MCDDLSGACEIAGVLHAAGCASIVRLDPATGRTTDDAVVVVDLDIRDRSDDDASAALAAFDPDTLAYVKIDSLGRGPVRGLTRGALASGRRVAFCPALPTAGRTVDGGVCFLDGVPVAETSAWQLESRTAPSSIADLLAPLDISSMVVADATSDADLDRLAERIDADDLLPIGSAGLFSALLRRHGVAEHDAPPDPGSSTPTDEHIAPAILVAVGTASPTALAQVDRLAERGARVVELDVTGDDDPDISELVERGSVTVIRWRPVDDVDPAVSAELDERLARVVTSAVRSDPGAPIVMTGGRTARRLLDDLGITELRVGRVVHHGGVVLLSDTGRVVAIRPGSFGDAGSLEDLANEATSLALEGNP